MALDSNHISRRRFTRAISLAALAPVPALRAQSWPTRTIRLVVPYSAGQGADVSARLIAERLSKRIGQPVVVENRAGAGGNIGATAVAHAAPDGYTLLYGTNATNAANAALYKAPGFTPDDFTAVSILNRSPMVISVNQSAAEQSITALLERARSNPGKVSIGIPSTTSAVVLGELEHRTGLRFLAVTYKGSPGAMQDLIGGTIEAIIDGILATLPHARTGRIRALAISSRDRSSSLADVPSLHEAGIDGFDLSPWSMIAAPRNTPEPIVALLNDHIRQILADPEVRETFLKQSGVVVGNDSAQSPEQANAFVRSEVERWGRIIRQAGLKTE